MALTPAEFIAVLDDAIAAAGRGGRRRIILELHTRPGGSLCGVTGRYMGTDDVGPVYGFTRRQCEEIRAVILAAAAEDLRSR